MPTTLKDIARDLGVSVVTVSKVLHNHNDIGAETRRRVLERARELNYRPNLAARSLVTGRMNLVGLIVPDLVHTFFAQVAKGLSTLLVSRGFSLIISSSQDDPELERKEIEQMLSRRVDVLILASVQRDASGIEAILNQHMPFVLLDRNFEGLKANFVGIDDRAAGATVTEHLIAMGCRRIAHLGGQFASTAIDRLAGYREALARHNLTMAPEYIFTMHCGDDNGDKNGYDGMKQLLSLDPLPDGVFCYNDPMALGAMRAIVEAGLRMPEDIAIVGCGNANYADLLRVSLSSLDQQSEHLGRTAGRLALSLLRSNGTALPAKRILANAKLIVRDSSRRTNVPSSQP